MCGHKLTINLWYKIYFFSFFANRNIYTFHIRVISKDNVTVKIGLSMCRSWTLEWHPRDSEALIQMRILQKPIVEWIFVQTRLQQDKNVKNFSLPIARFQSITRDQSQILLCQTLLICNFAHKRLWKYISSTTPFRIFISLLHWKGRSTSVIWTASRPSKICGTFCQYICMAMSIWGVLNCSQSHLRTSGMCVFKAVVELTVW